jgi:hypothetical protein
MSNCLLSRIAVYWAIRPPFATKGTTQYQGKTPGPHANGALDMRIHQCEYQFLHTNLHRGIPLGSAHARFIAPGLYAHVSRPYHAQDVCIAGRVTKHCSMSPSPMSGRGFC